MAKSLRQILGGNNLTGVIQGIKSGLPDTMPPSFLSPTLRQGVDGDHGVYKKVEGTRKTARIAMYGSPSQVRELTGVSEVPVKLIHSLESIHHNPSTLVKLKSLNEAEQELGIEEIARQTRDFRQLFDNLRVATMASALLTGFIYFDSDGNLLPSSSGARVSVDFGIPSGNKDQLNVFGGGAIIGASWATTSTKIHVDVQQIKSAAKRKTGYPLRHAFYGENILDYILTNDHLKEIIVRNPGMQAAFTSGQIPDGFLGLSWHPANDAFFVDQNGVVQDQFGDDNVLFTPEPSPDWFQWLEGSYPVPTNVGSLTDDSAAAASNVALKQGRFSYAKVSDDPCTIKQVAGDTFLPVIKVPGAMFIATVAGF